MPEMMNKQQLKTNDNIVPTNDVTKFTNILKSKPSPVVIVVTLRTRYRLRQSVRKEENNFINIHIANVSKFVIGCVDADERKEHLNFKSQRNNCVRAGSRVYQRKNRVLSSALYLAFQMLNFVCGP